MDAMRIRLREGRLDLTDAVRRESARFDLPAGATLRDRDADTDGLPVERAVTVRTDGVDVPVGTGLWVRDADLTPRDHFDYAADAAYPPGEYVIEVDAELKTYFRVDAPLRVDAADGTLRLRFGDPTDLFVGGRPRRRRPYETVRTTTDGADLLRTVSWFGATTATESPERSFPTLRGHPPRVVLDDSFSPPEGLSLPDTGLRLRLPAEPSFAFAAAPLAAYLGARVDRADDPALGVVDESAPLVSLPGDPEAFAAAAHRLTRRVFLLDCVVRTEGQYPVDLSLRERVERSAGGALDPAALYDRPLAERVRAYLRLPEAVVDDAAPTWPLAATVEPDPSNVVALPALVDELAAVRVASPERVRGTDARPVALSAFLDGAAASTRSAAEVFAGDATFVRTDPVDAADEVYIGDDIPVTADAFVPAGARHRHARAPSDDPLSVLLVANDPEMAVEADRAAAAYDAETAAASVDIEVSTVRGASRDRLAALVREGADVLHFVGHAAPEGLKCPDGTLDLAGVDHGVDAFVLNACQSYRQGVRLVEGGAAAGAVALSDVANADAVDVGLLLARLLAVGFPFRVATRLARRLSVVGGQYAVVGDGALTLAQPEGFVPMVGAVDERDDGRYDLRLRLVPTPQFGLGCLVSPALDAPERFLNAGETRTFVLDGDRLTALFERASLPVEYDGDLAWSDDLLPFE